MNFKFTTSKQFGGNSNPAQCQKSYYFFLKIYRNCCKFPVLFFVSFDSFFHIDLGARPVVLVASSIHTRLERELGTLRQPQRSGDLAVSAVPWPCRTGGDLWSALRPAACPHWPAPLFTYLPSSDPPHKVAIFPKLFECALAVLARMSVVAWTTLCGVYCHILQLQSKLTLCPCIVSWCMD